MMGCGKCGLLAADFDAVDDEDDCAGFVAVENFVGWLLYNPWKLGARVAERVETLLAMMLDVSG